MTLPTLHNQSSASINNDVKIETRLLWLGKDQRKTCSLCVIFTRPIFEKYCYRWSKKDDNMHNIKMIVEYIVRKPIFNISFKRKDWDKTLVNKASNKIDKNLTTDPALLYQIFLILSKTWDIPLEHSLSYEVKSSPAVMFKAKDIFLKNDKA